MTSNNNNYSESSGLGVFSISKSGDLTTDLNTSFPINVSPEPLAEQPILPTTPPLGELPKIPISANPNPNPYLTSAAIVPLVS